MRRRPTITPSTVSRWRSPFPRVERGSARGEMMIIIAEADRRTKMPRCVRSSAAMGARSRYPPVYTDGLM